MNNSFSSQKISETGNLDSSLISRQIKINIMAKFMQTKFEKQKLKQSEVADELGYSSRNLQRYRNYKCIYVFTLYNSAKYHL